MFRHATVIAAASVVLMLSSLATAETFTVDGTTYTAIWYDDFNDNSIDATKWPVATYITESGGALRHTTTPKKTTTSANFGSDFTGATEWAYLFRVTVPTTMTSVSDRVGYVFQTEDLSLCAYKNTSSVWELWAGTGGYYTNNAFYYKSGNLNLGQAYTIAVHKNAGVNEYDFFIDGVEVLSDSASSRYTGVEIPSTITFGHASSTGNCPVIFDYMYAGMPTGDLRIKKFLDADQDGSFDGADEWLPGWSFTLTDSDDNPVAGGPFITGADGTKLITGLLAGDYTITETVKDDWEGTASPMVVTVTTGEVAEALFGNRLRGDYNRDGYVDQTDYLYWANRYDQAVSHNYDGGDGDGSGIIDQTDYLVWANRYSNGTPPEGGSAPVPEPATMALLGIGGLGLLLRKRSR